MSTAMVTARGGMPAATRGKSARMGAKVVKSVGGGRVALTGRRGGRSLVVRAAEEEEDDAQPVSMTRKRVSGGTNTTQRWLHANATPLFPLREPQKMPTK